MLLGILAKYDATFYAYGSRTKERHHPFSDVDLFVCGKIDLVRIRAELEESNLPIKVDIQLLERISSDFMRLIRPDIVCIQPSSLFLKVERNTFHHFAYLPHLLGFSVQQERGTKWIKAGLGSSMFNIACGGEVSEEKMESHIQSTRQHYNGQPFAWWLGGTTHPNYLGKRLVKEGFVRETTEYAMICSLAGTQVAEAAFSVRQVETIEQLGDFIALLEPYDPSVTTFYGKLKTSQLCKNERFFVGYEGKVPVTTALLYLEEDVAGIFSLTTREDYRGRGYGTAMMRYLMRYAKAAGADFLSLSASSDSGYSIYKKLGFETIGIFDCCELS